MTRGDSEHEGLQARASVRPLVGCSEKLGGAGHSFEKLRNSCGKALKNFADRSTLPIAPAELKNSLTVIANAELADAIARPGEAITAVHASRNHGLQLNGRGTDC